MELIICFVDWSNLDLWWFMKNKFEILESFGFVLMQNASLFMLKSKYTKILILSDHRIGVWRWELGWLEAQHDKIYFHFLGMLPWYDKSHDVPIKEWIDLSMYMGMLSLIYHQYHLIHHGLYSLKLSLLKIKLSLLNPWEIHWRKEYRHPWKDLQ